MATDNWQKWFPGLVGQAGKRFEFAYEDAPDGRQLMIVRDVKEGVVIARTDDGGWQWHEKGGRIVRRWGLQVSEGDNESLKIHVEGSNRSFLHNGDGSVVMENNGTKILYKKVNGELRKMAARVQNDLVSYSEDGMAVKIEFASGHTLVRTRPGDYLLMAPDGSATVMKGDVWPDEEMGGYRYRLCRTEGQGISDCHFAATGSPVMPVRTAIQCPA